MAFRIKFSGLMRLLIGDSLYSRANSMRRNTVYTVNALISKKKIRLYSKLYQVIFKNRRSNLRAKAPHRKCSEIIIFRPFLISEMHCLPKHRKRICSARILKLHNIVQIIACKRYQGYKEFPLTSV